MTYNPPIDPTSLRCLYSRTLNAAEQTDDKAPNRILLTGHSHQAQPDVADEAARYATSLAHKFVDDKWGVIFGEVLPEFQKGIAKRIGCADPNSIINGHNTHELVSPFLSSWHWDHETRIVSTSSEFQSLLRQLLALQGQRDVDVEFVSTEDKDSLTDRIVKAITPGTNAVLVSTVFFNDGFVLQDVPRIVEKASSVGASVLLDAAHMCNVRMMNVDRDYGDAFVTGTGYKYAQGGEGAAWLRVPKSTRLIPTITGWFADFPALKEEKYPVPIRYNEGAAKFAGATFDATGLCRQNAAFKLMDERGLTVELLERNNLYQTKYLMDVFEEFGLRKYNCEVVSSPLDARRGPFLAIDIGTAERAGKVQSMLKNDYAIWTDNRGKILRLGPAPYTLQEELDWGMRYLSETLKKTP